MRVRRTSVAMMVGLSAALVLAACGSSSTAGSPSSTSSSGNAFVLSEFTIIPPTATIHAGSVAITADNVGGEVHELVIVRAASTAALPMKSDGSVDEDKITASDKIGEIDKVAARSQQTKTFQLPSGTYVAFCNIVDTMMGPDTTMMGSGAPTMNGASTTMGGMGTGTGHVHFAKGMHATFTVQ